MRFTGILGGLSSTDGRWGAARRLRARRFVSICSPVRSKRRFLNRRTFLTGTILTGLGSVWTATSSAWGARFLRARLAELEEQKRREQLAELKGEHVKAEWGSQIRSYVLHPYQMVKDHRTEYETGNTAAVLDGRLDEFMEAYLRSTVGQ